MQFVNSLWTSNGSYNELQSQVEIGQRVKVFAEAEAKTIIIDAEEVGRMLGGLIRSLHPYLSPHLSFSRSSSK